MASDEGYNVIEEEQWILDTIERFKRAPLKIAIPKDGSLSDISEEIFSSLGISIPKRNKNDRLSFATSPDGSVGIMYPRNKDLCLVVKKGWVDMAVVGTDRIVESGLGNIYGEIIDDSIRCIAPTSDLNWDAWKWDIVIATANPADIQNVNQISSVVTQYQRIAEQYFSSIDQSVDIIASNGGTEAYAHFDVDAIVDLTDTGKSLKENKLTKMDVIFTVSPVLIVNTDCYRENSILFKTNL